jgi:hypothetical protein
VKIGASGDASAFGYHANFDFSFSQSSAAQVARNLEQKRSGSLTLTEARCATMKAQLRGINFHPSFLAEVATISTAEGALLLLEKYGTHYYKSAVLGGKLSLVTVVDKQWETSTTSNFLQQHSELSFGAGVSSSAFSVDGSFSQTKDSEVSEESRQEYESASSRSTILTEGGSPGSFSPDSQDGFSSAPTTFGGSQSFPPLSYHFLLCLLCLLQPGLIRLTYFLFQSITSLHQSMISSR